MEVRHVPGSSMGSEGELIVNLMRILISDASKNEVLTLVHEVGEVIYAFNGEGYEKLRSVMMEYLRKQGVDVDKDIGFYQAKYAEKEGTKTRASAEKEYILDTFAGLFATEDGVKSFIECVEKSKAMTTSEKQGLYRAIVDALRKIIDNLKKLIAGNPVDHAGYIVMNATVEKVNEMMKLFVDVISETKDIIDGISDGDMVNVVTDGFANSIAFTTENDPVVIVEEDILDGVPKNNWISVVKDTIKQKFSDGIPVSGRLIYVNKTTRNEFTKSKTTQYYFSHKKDLYADKLRSSNNLDEIVLASTNYINEAPNHKRIDNIKEFARGDVLMQVGQNQYAAKVIVGFTNNKNMVLYDVIDFKPTAFSLKKIGMRSPNNRRKTAEDGSNMPIYGNSVSQSEPIVNSNFMQSSEKYSDKSKNGAEADAALTEKGASKVRTAHQVDVNLREKNASEARTASQVDVALLDRKETISSDMSDQERERILRGKTFMVEEYLGQADQAIEDNAESLKSKKRDIVKGALIKIGEIFGIYHEYKNDDFDMDVVVSKRTIRESGNKKITDPKQLAKLLPIIDTAVQNAVVIECHKNRYYFERSTINFAVLLGGYIDGDYFIPIRFGVKMTRNGGNYLYVVIDSEGIKKDRVLKYEGPKKSGDAYSRLSEVSIADVFENVNSKDLIRYTPDGFLNDTKKKIKADALLETEKYTEEKNDRQYEKYVDKKQKFEAVSMLKDLAKDKGYTAVEDTNSNLYTNDKGQQKVAEVTYDDEGNLIPFGKRFDDKNNNVRYQVDVNLREKNGKETVEKEDLRRV